MSDEKAKPPATALPMPTSPGAPGRPPLPNLGLTPAAAGVPVAPHPDPVSQMVSRPANFTASQALAGVGAASQGVAAQRAAAPSAFPTWDLLPPNMTINPRRIRS
jgi:hypothetical protein